MKTFFALLFAAAVVVVVAPLANVSATAAPTPAIGQVAEPPAPVAQTPQVSDALPVISPQTAGLIEVLLNGLGIL